MLRKADIIVSDLNSCFEIHNLFPEGDALLIVPPVASIDMASIGVHVLQACARKAGFSVNVFYANINYSSFIGTEKYLPLMDFNHFYWIMGERIFARAAYGTGPLLKKNRAVKYRSSEIIGKDKAEEMAGLPVYLMGWEGFDKVDVEEYENRAIEWVDAIAQRIADLPYKVVGCSSCMEQTNATIAILRRVKELRPDIITLVGGSNCAGPMAKGIVSLDPDRKIIDYIFSGYSEKNFINFLKDIKAGKLPDSRIITGESIDDIDFLPINDYSEYFDQRNRFIPIYSFISKSFQIPYESSRGCHWGEKSHCKFCACNVNDIRFREKPPDKVLKELDHMVSEYGVDQIFTSDTIMPESYFETLLPQLSERADKFKIYYEQRTTTSLAKVMMLKKAGLNYICAGIEALSSDLLQIMGKGIRAWQNIVYLRYLRSVEMETYWYLLWGFPGDNIEAYEETVSIIPCLYHLEPPKAFFHVGLDRFSPYYENASEYGIKKIVPAKSYYACFPEYADIEKLAYHFEGQYESAGYNSPKVIEDMIKEFKIWNKKWADDIPVLRLEKEGGEYFVKDTRGLEGADSEIRINNDQAEMLLKKMIGDKDPWLEWALRNKLALKVDSFYVPLVTADPELLVE